LTQSCLNTKIRKTLHEGKLASVTYADGKVRKNLKTRNTVSDYIVFHTGNSFYLEYVILKEKDMYKINNRLWNSCDLVSFPWNTCKMSENGFKKYPAFLTHFSLLLYFSMSFFPLCAVYVEQEKPIKTSLLK
jgi:hypothetical protein